MSKNEHQPLDFSMILASSVHDMKNSLGLLLNSLEEVIDESPPSNKRQANQFAILQYEASRINSELVQLLSLYNLGQSRLSVRIDEHYVIDMLEEQLARNQRLLDSKNITAIIECDADCMWYFDTDLVGSVIHNVIVNSVRYTRSNIMISAEITECLEHGEPSLFIRINDDGPGFPEAMLLTAIQPSTSATSTQLGLYFAEQVAAHHKQSTRSGTVTINNEGSLGGAQFILCLP